jgi:hypothetical protein
VTVPPGHFVLYANLDPPLDAGDYIFRVNQDLSATSAGQTLDPSQLTVDELPLHVRVRSPRYLLPPDEVLSTFPPAASEGAYGDRLPQIVIKRRTLPWERLVGPGLEGTPWLALVLIAEGEAELKLNQPIADCVTPGVVLAGVADSELGSYLSIRKSMVDKVFPTQQDVPLLAHAREVDINDTEMMMGDDDGFLAVVISNRLPLAGRNDAGDETPIKYLACLVNLEGQFEQLLPEAPAPTFVLDFPVFTETMQVSVSGLDQLTMGRSPSPPSPVVNAAHEETAEAAAFTTEQLVVAAPQSGSSAPFTRSQQWSVETTERSYANVYAEMAAPFGQASAVISGDLSSLIDPLLAFPVLLQWSFTSTGDVDFRELMRNLDNGLLGTAVETKPDTVTQAAWDAKLAAERAGRPPIEVVETGQVGLDSRTRVGDTVRTWYRGPCVAHPTADPPTGRLPLAHASDQLRIVVPDGREDISLAAAFEIGRLLALSRPAMVAALLRWRQEDYQTARQQAIWSGNESFVTGLLSGEAVIGPRLGESLGRALTRNLVANPSGVLGDPTPLVAPGRPLDVDGTAEGLVGSGLGLSPEVLSGEPVSILGTLRTTPVAVTPVNDKGPVLATANSTALRAALNLQVARFAVDTIRTKVGDVAAVSDALDRLLGGDTP